MLISRLLISNEFGNVIENNINYNIIENSNIELLQDKYITRMKVKIFAEKLGMMSIIMDKIELKNNSYCYVYTTDYQVVAGPIYQKSIQDYLIIKNIPADELVIEVVANDLKDFNLNLKEVNYYSIVKQAGKTGKDKSQDLDMLLGTNDSCHTCNGGVKSYADFIDETSECNWLGHGNYGEIFKIENLKGVNDYDYNASRSSCVIMIPDCSTNQNYGGENGTLMNFPYIDCQDPLDCGQGFIFTVYHLGAIQEIVRADSVIKSDGVDYNDSIANTEFLDKVLIRFNWQHEYGTPWNLEDINCEASPTNFDLWRSSIDFSEVIDYCGIRVFAYQKLFDLTILKMAQKPFYKEHHLGWTAQGYFDVDNEDKAKSPSNFKILGRRAKKPTSIFENYNTYFENYDFYIRNEYT